ncbi:hypothetical protein DAPPUDRAFT_110855 [Daphnia pulex]|uniref:Uncharacterized protein n=1 Tax=Daphnia pulex TaxID=6669 RepID=E9H7C8_DAPPU|nr:hypothetical protein DAPPUDRAFT_110855 [Daphnia pulex]|eukprot:EFX72387.1 hypothetical protein DAPPUDRAFT_110855 [Daphnia pulex]
MSKQEFASLSECDKPLRLKTPGGRRLCWIKKYNASIKSCKKQPKIRKKLSWKQDGTKLSWQKLFANLNQAEKKFQQLEKRYDQLKESLDLLKGGMVRANQEHKDVVSERDKLKAKLPLLEMAPHAECSSNAFYDLSINFSPTENVRIDEVASDEPPSTLVMDKQRWYTDHEMANFLNQLKKSGILLEKVTYISKGVEISIGTEQTGVITNFTIFGVDEMMESIRFYKAEDKEDIPNCKLPNVDGYISGMTKDATTRLLRNLNERKIQAGARR